MAGGMNRTRKDVGYGLTNALQNLAQAPIQAKRNPTVNDFVESGTLWINTVTNSAFISCGSIAGQALWDGIANAPLSVNATAATPADLVFILSGTGAPTFNAPQGSLYLRVDGNSTSTRAYIATSVPGTWTNIVTAA